MAVKAGCLASLPRHHAARKAALIFLSASRHSRFAPSYLCPPRRCAFHPETRRRLLLLAVPLISKCLLAACRIPDLGRAVNTYRDNMFAIGRPANGAYPLGAAGIVDQQAPGSCILDLHGLVFTGRGKAAPIGRPGNGIHRTSMPTITIGVAPKHIPDLDRFIAAPSGNTVPTGRPGCHIDPRRVIAKN
jgi:hypothetical protein